MKKAALYVAGRIIVADSHLAAYQQLSVTEQHSELISGVFDSDTEEFDSDQIDDHFYDKEIVLIRHCETDGEGPDPSISDRGLEQAHHLAATLQTLNLDGFVGKTSPLLRCLQTCAVLSENMDIHFDIEPGIVEKGPDYIVPSRNEEFPQFSWPDQGEFPLFEESPKDFEDRIGLVLQNLPHKSILITHLGVVCNLAKFALCPKKVTEMIDGFLPASMTVIRRQEWQQMDCLGQLLRHELLK